MRFGMIAAAIAATVCASQADAAITINVKQVGANVVTTGSGSFDTTSGLGDVYSGPAGAAVGATGGLIRVGSAGILQYRTGLFGQFLGNGGLVPTTTSSGDLFGVGNFGTLIYLPVNYVSGAMLNGSATYLNTTIAALGFTPGSYIFASTIDSVTINIDAAVPEPATWAMMILGMGAVGYAMRRRKQVAALA